MMTDPIADMLTQLRNASAVKKADVILPYSRVKHQIASVLAGEGYVGKVEQITEEGKSPKLRIVLKYRSNGKPFIKHVERMSKPSQRIYVTKDSLPRVLSGFGIAIISSSQGIMTNKQARKTGVGGELLLEIW